MYVFFCILLQGRQQCFEGWERSMEGNSIASNQLMPLSIVSSQVLYLVGSEHILRPTLYVCCISYCCFINFWLWIAQKLLLTFWDKLTININQDNIFCLVKLKKKKKLLNYEHEPTLKIYGFKKPHTLKQYVHSVFFKPYIDDLSTSTIIFINAIFQTNLVILKVSIKKNIDVFLNVKANIYIKLILDP